MKKIISVSLTLILILGVIFSAPPSLFLSSAKAQNIINSPNLSMLPSTAVKTNVIPIVPASPSQSPSNIGNVPSNINNPNVLTNLNNQNPVRPGVTAISPVIPARTFPPVNPNQQQQQGRAAAPIPNAGTSQSVYEGTTVILDGSKSYDPNPGGSIVNYRWVQTSGIPVMLVGSGSNTPNPTFVAPRLHTIGSTTTTTGTLTFSLTVTDNFGLTSIAPSTTTVIILYNPQLHNPQTNSPFFTQTPNTGQQQNQHLPLPQQIPFQQLQRSPQQQLPSITGSKVIPFLPPAAKPNNTLQTHLSVPNSSVQVPTNNVNNKTLSAIQSNNTNSTLVTPPTVASIVGPQSNNVNTTLVSPNSTQATTFDASTININTVLNNNTTLPSSAYYHLKPSDLNITIVGTLCGFTTLTKTKFCLDDAGYSGLQALPATSLEIPKGGWCPPIGPCYSTYQYSVIVTDKYDKCSVSSSDWFKDGEFSQHCRKIFVSLFDSGCGGLNLLTSSTEIRTCNIEVDASPPYQVPETTIISAIDNNHAPIQQGDQTASDTITFHFAGHANEKDASIVGFVCQSDLSAVLFIPVPQSCNSDSMTYHNVPFGTHSFSVYSEDQETVDSTPATFSWTRSQNALSSDIDKDGIINNVDTQPLTFSNDFSDQPIGGTTTGTIATRGDQQVTIYDAPNPDGVTVLADPLGGINPAKIHINNCKGGIGNADYTFNAGDVFTLTCHSFDVAVDPTSTGPISASYLMDDGKTIVTANSIAPGNGLDVDTTAQKFNAPSTNTVPITLSTQGTTLQLQPGNSVVEDKTPPDTSIKSAIDGNNINIPVDQTGLTVSDKISVRFAATDNVAVAKIQCSIDGQTPTDCTNTNPILYQNLKPGAHTVQIVSTDTAGNVDPTPAVLKWTIITPAQGVNHLIGIANGLTTPIKSSLVAKLGSALTFLTDNSPNNDKGACTQLDGFITAVNTYASTGRLTPQQASELLHTLPYSAQEIKTAIGCK